MALTPLVTAITPPSGSSGGVAETEVPLLQQIANLLANGAGGGGQGVVLVNGSASAYDYRAYTYFGTTNNIQSITYKSGGAGGTVVAVDRYNYVNGGSANNDNVSVIATTTS